MAWHITSKAAVKRVYDTLNEMTNEAEAAGKDAEWRRTRWSADTNRTKGCPMPAAYKLICFPIQRRYAAF
jgi:hypothetical protein